MSKVFQQLHILTDQELETLYTNIAAHILKYQELSNAEQVELGRKNRDLVFAEIKRRGELAAKGDYKAGTRDDEGILAMMGYRVGKHNGVPEKMRRAILERVVSGPLPPIANLALLQEWGDDNSEKRLARIATRICFFVVKNASFNSENYDQALTEWRNDMDWLKEAYYVPRQYSFKWPNVHFEDEAGTK